MLLMGKDTLKVLEARFDLKNNIGIFPDAGDLQGKVLRESRAGHLMVPTVARFVSFQRLHRTFRRLRQKNSTASEQDSQGRGSIDGKRRDGC